MASNKRTGLLIKIAVALVAPAVLFWLFVSTLEDTIAEPYQLDGASLASWTLVLNEPGRPGLSRLGLRPPTLLRPTLFDQLFNRTMESMTSPPDDLLPIVLEREYQRGLASVLPPDELLTAAREAGLDQVTLTPVCMAVKRQPFDGRTRQFYFVVFEAPAIAAFRADLAQLAAERGGTLELADAGFLPVLPIAGSDAGFASWWPLDFDREADCRAPVE